MKYKLLFLIFFGTVIAVAQTGNFTVEGYKQFLGTHQNMSSSELLALHPAGVFTSTGYSTAQQPLYLDSIIGKYHLTGNEQALIQQHGFMVSERLSYRSFGDAYNDIWEKDLPVFISTDAMLHALHSSYDAILKDVEYVMLEPDLSTLLGQMYNTLPALSSTYDSIPAMRQMLRDFDVYISVPRILLGDQVAPYYAENASTVATLLGMIQSEQPASFPLFGSQERLIDFSQFKVRGHYANTDYPKLAKYFKAMMWLGRTEMYLIAPQSFGSQVPFEDIQRQTIDAALVNEAVGTGTTHNLFAQMDSVIQFFVGESDNVTIPNVRELCSELNITSASQLLDTMIVKQFQDSLVTHSYAFQRILSQILFNDPMSPDSIRPASAFMLFGQRFIIDSYITGQVVYDKILYNGTRVARILPSTLDVLYGLGNDAAAQLLESELNEYHYGSNLAAVRYLIDSYDSTFWQSSLFNLWLNCIRTMNPPQQRDSLPSFMQTAAWWQEKMNTQLASWAELRHDNLLYAKQSYTGGFQCSYPYGYVEPVPRFYDALKKFATIAEEHFTSMQMPTGNLKEYVLQYFRDFENTADTLGIIARKESAGEELTTLETSFMKKMLYATEGCGPSFSGWYYDLFYTGYDGIFKKDYLVADIHTAPTDEGGNPVGWVAHVGTGPVNLGVVVASDPSGQAVAYVAPCMSYHEYTTTNFLRLSDEEWKSSYLASSTRPSFVNLYLADTSGSSRGAGKNLLMSPTDVKPPLTLPSAFVLHQNYPNPFNGGTVIAFTLLTSSHDDPVAVTIYNSVGQAVSHILNRVLQAGNYVARWDGKDEYGIDAASGVYFCEVRLGSTIQTIKMNLVR